MPDMPSVPLARPQRRVRRQRLSNDERLCRLVGELVAATLDVAASDLRSPRRGQAQVAFARQAAMYIGHVVFGLSLTRLGQGFGRDRTTARHACRLIEDCRDDPAIDAFFGLLETACCEAVSKGCAEWRTRP